MKIFLKKNLAKGLCFILGSLFTFFIQEGWQYWKESRVEKKKGGQAETIISKDENSIVNRFEYQLCKQISLESFCPLDIELKIPEEINDLPDRSQQLFIKTLPQKISDYNKSCAEKSDVERKNEIIRFFELVNSKFALAMKAGPPETFDINKSYKKLSEECQILIKTNEQETEFSYSDFRLFTPVYNGKNDFAGFAFLARSDQCGSDCTEHGYFINGDEYPLKIHRVEALDGDSLGHHLIYLDYSLYSSEFIWGQSEEHFGCHFFKIKRFQVKNNQIQLIEEKISKKKYSFEKTKSDENCQIFPGIKILLKE